MVLVAAHVSIRTLRFGCLSAGSRQGSADVRLRKATATPEWEFVGPTNVGGRIVDIEYDPLNPAIVFAGAATGGVF
jgi:hypothetical protein